MVKTPPTKAEDKTYELWVRFLGWEDLLEKAWQLTPVFLPGEPHGQRSLAGYTPWGLRVGHDCSDLAGTHVYPGLK